MYSLSSLVLDANLSQKQDMTEELYLIWELIFFANPLQIHDVAEETHIFLMKTILLQATI